MAIDWTAVTKKAKRQDAAYNAKATQGAENRAVYQAIAKNKAATAAQMKANPSMLTSKITPITMAQTAAGVAKGSIPNAFQNQKESGIERAADIVSAGTSSLAGGAANAVRLATTGKYSPSGLISRGIDKINGTNYTEQNAANQKSFANKMMDNSLLYSQNAKRGLGKIGQAGVDIGSAATQIGLMALTGNAAGALGAGSDATGALTKGLMAIQQGGQGAYDAEKSGAGEGTQALYGILQGATGYATEGISNVGALGKVFGNGVADSKIEQASAKAISKFIKSDVGRAVANRLATGAEAGIGEALEQNFQDALTPVYQRLTYDKNAKLNAEDMIYNGLVAGAVGGIVGGAGKNNLKALETENDAKAAERLTAAKNAPPVTNTAPDLSQVAPNLARPSQNIAQEAVQAPLSDINLKPVNLPTLEQNAGEAKQTAADAKTPTNEKSSSVATSLFPENSIGAKITTPKPNIPLETGETSKSETPNAVGAKSAEFGYEESPTQNRFAENTFTEEEVANTPSLENSHKVNPDAYVDRNAQERYDSDYEGEKADLFGSKQKWDDADTKLAIMILENETAKARKTGEWGEVAKLNKKYAAMGTTWGQEGRQRQRFANTPTEIISEAAATLSDIEAEEKGKTRTSKETAQDNKAKEQSNDVGKKVAEIVKDTAKKISNSYSNHTRKARFSNLKTIEGNQAGEPFTFEYEDKVGEALANSIEKSVTTKPKQQTTFLKEIANQLKAFAKETMPEKEKSTTAKVTATDRLKDYLANKDFYSNAWSLAQDELRRRYANDPDMLASLENFTNSTIGFRGNPSDRNTIMIRSLVNSAIESGETKQVLRLQETLGFTKTADNIANDLINKTGATGTDAEIIRAAASQYVNDVLATSELDATKTVNAKVKSAMHDIGVTISDTVTKNAKEKAGISKAVTDLLVNKYGLGTADASNVANVVNEHFNKLVSDATQKKLESIFNKTNTTANVKPFMQKLTEMINMGVFDNSQYSEAAAEKLFGLKVQESGITSEKFKGLLKTIAEKADKLDNIKQGDTASVVSLIKDLNKIRKTTGMFSKETSAQMSEFLDYASKLPDGEAFLRDVAAQQIRNVASDYQKTSTLNAIKNYRVMGMLSKATTILRNLTANNIFDPIESLSTNAGVPLDILLSKYTKTRSTSVDKSWFSSAKRKGSIDGFVKSAIQVGLDADVTNSSSKYETHSGRTFKMTGNPVERFLSTWAKWENYGLQSTDEFQKGGIAAETQRGIDQLKSKGLVAKDALTGRAEEVAKQRTFQNDGALATAMLKGRDALNVFSVKDKRGGSLGAGDVAVPFAKVPANIVAQGGNYSPAGFIKAIGNLGKTLAQAHEGTLTADQQAKAVMDFGRATTGSAGIAMFTALALKGIIKVAGADDKDKEALQTSEGQSGTQFNISALNRWVNGKSADWKDGDTLMSIGFLEPINAQMAMGAMIADAYKDDEKFGLADVANANVSSVFQSVLDLPAMSQISDLVNGYKRSSADKTSGKLGDAALGYGASQAASFLIPNIIGGVATGMDETVRNTYTSKNPLKRASDNIVSKIPGLRNTLPAKQDSYGNDVQNTGNKLLDTLNANILPGQIGKYSTSEVNQELYRLDTKYPVRNAPNTIKSNKLTYALTLDEKAKYLKTMGQTENSLMQAMISSSAYKSMTDTQKSDALKNLMAYASDKANREFVTSKGAKYTSEKYEKVYEAERQGVSPTAYFTYKTKLDEINDDDTVTELEAARALEKTALSQSEKGKLWQNQNVKFSAEKNPYTGTLAQKGLAPEKTIEIMEAFDTIDDAIDKNYVKAYKGPSAAQVKAAYLSQWLTRQGYNANQRAAITNVFTTWQMIPIDKPSKKATAFVSANPMP